MSRQTGAFIVLRLLLLLTPIYFEPRLFSGGPTLFFDDFYRITCFLPLGKATTHVDHILITQFQQRFGRQLRPFVKYSMHDYFSRFVRDDLLDMEIEEPS